MVAPASTRVEEMASWVEVEYAVKCFALVTQTSPYRIRLDLETIVQLTGSRTLRDVA